MEKTQFVLSAGNSSNIAEIAILAAHKKYFEGNSENLRFSDEAESALYNAVIMYFTGNS